MDGHSQLPVNVNRDLLHQQLNDMLEMSECCEVARGTTPIQNSFSPTTALKPPLT